MAGLTRSNLLKVKRFKENKADFEQQTVRASWFYLAWAILMLSALLMDYLEIGNVPGMELAAPYLPWKN